MIFNPVLTGGSSVKLEYDEADYMLSIIDSSESNDPYRNVTATISKGSSTNTITLNNVPKDADFKVGYHEPNGGRYMRILYYDPVKTMTTGTYTFTSNYQIEDTEYYLLVIKTDDGYALYQLCPINDDNIYECYLRKMNGTDF